MLRAAIFLMLSLVAFSARAQQLGQFPEDVAPAGAYYVPVLKCIGQQNCNEKVKLSTLGLSTGRPADKNVFIGSVNAANYYKLANAANIPEILASGKIGLYQHANGNSGLSSPQLSQLWLTWNATGVTTTGQGESVGEVGNSTNFSSQYLGYFGGAFPNEVNQNFNEVSGTGQISGLAGSLYPTKIYYAYFQASDLTAAEAMTQAAYIGGAKNVATIITPNAGTEDLDDPFATSLYWANVRTLALYNGAMALDVPPTYAFVRGSAYISMIEQMIAWGVSQNLRVSLIISPNGLGTCAFDSAFFENTESLVGQLQATGSMPTQFIVENYTPGCGNDVETDTTPESLNVVALYLARAVVTAAPGTNTAVNGVADAGLEALTSNVPILTASLSNAHIGPLNIADVAGAGTMASQSSANVQITGGSLNGSIQFHTSQTPLFLNGLVVQGSNGATFMNEGQSASITSMSWSGGSVSVTTALPTHVNVGDSVTISGVSPSGYNGSWTVATIPASTVCTNCFTFALATSPGAVTTNGQVNGGNVLTFATTGGDNTSVQIQGSLDIRNGIYFSTETGASVFSGQTPIFESGLVVQGSNGGDFLSMSGANGTLYLDSPSGIPANFQATGLITANTLNVPGNIGALSKPATFNSNGLTVGWSYASTGETDFFMGPGSSSGGISLYSLNSSGVVQQAASSPVLTFGANGSVQSASYLSAAQYLSVGVYSYSSLLAAGQSGRVVFCSNCLKPGESSGAGTGTLVYDDGHSHWVSSAGTVAAH